MADLAFSGKGSRDARSGREWVECGSLTRISRLVGLRYRLTADEADDLHQESCLALLRQSPTIVLNATYIFRTVASKAVDLLRARSHSRMRSSTPRSCSAPELASLLAAAADCLPADVRTYYDLRYREGQTQKEAGSRLGLRRSSVRWLEHRVLRALGADEAPARN